MLIAVGIILGISVPLFAVLAWDYSVCPTVVMVPAGTNLSVQPTRHLDYNFTVSKVLLGSKRGLQGVFSSHNPVILYLMTINQYNSFNSTGTASSYVWTSGQITYGDYVSCGLKSQPLCSNYPSVVLGSYYLVFDNPSQMVIAKITVSQNIQLGSC